MTYREAEAIIRENTGSPYTAERTSVVEAMVYQGFDTLNADKQVFQYFRNWDDTISEADAVVLAKRYPNIFG